MSDWEPFSEKYKRDCHLISPVQEFEKSEQTRLLQQAASIHAGSRATIEVFNDWIDNWLLKQIKFESFTGEDGSRIEFDAPSGDIPLLKKPFRVRDGKEIENWPRYCRDRKVPYAGDLTIRCTVYPPPNTDENIVSKNISAGRIPIMLGSKMCYLHGLTPEERVKQGECIADPLGYFLIKSKRSIVAQERLRSSLPIIVPDKDGKLTCKYTSPTIRTSKLVALETGKKRKTIKVTKLTDINKKEVLEIKGKEQKKRIKKFNIRSKLSLPPFTIYQLFHPELNMMQILEKYITPYIPNGYEDEIINGMYISIIKSRDLDPVQYIARKRQEKYDEDLREDLETDYKNRIFSDLFHDVEINDPELTEEEKREIETELKLHQLGYMMVRYVSCIQGIIPPDSRDAWCNKKFDLGGRSMMILFGGLFEKTVREAKAEAKGVYRDFANLVSKYASNIIEKEFKTSFNTDKWGVKDSYRKENITEMTKDATPIDSWSQAAKNNTPSSRKSKISGARAVQPSQLNRHCPAETPEGETNGLIKYNCLTYKPSLEVPREELLEILRGNYYYNGKKGHPIGEKKSDQNPYLILLNGYMVNRESKILFSSRELYNFLREVRRNQVVTDRGVRLKISNTTEIFVDDSLCTIEIYTDCCRPCCPYLVVNQKTNNLVIDEIKDGWKKSYHELMRLGAIEYIASREEENDDFVLSYSYDNFLEKKKSIRYSHCTFDPIQMLSLTTSISPMGDHQPGPRNTYQCLHPDTKVMMSDYTYKKIGDIKVGDIVMSFHPIYHFLEPTKVINQFVKETNKKIVKVKSISGEEIICTDDHLFMTTEGWKRPKDFTEDTILCMRDYPKNKKYAHLVSGRVCTVTPEKNCLISDITTESENHSFIAEGFMVHNSSMSKQALTLFPFFNHHLNFPSEYKQLLHATRPFTETVTAFLPRLDIMPNTQTIIVGFMTDPDNQEDAIVVNEDFIKKGGMTYVRYMTNTYVQEISNVNEEFTKPKPRKNEMEIMPTRYDAIGEDGMPILDRKINQGDCIIGKVDTITKSNISVFAGIKEDGYVDRVRITRDSDTQFPKIETKLRRTQGYMAGDKEAFRYSQKGTIGRIAKRGEIGVIIEGPNKGMSIELLFNPHGFPSRQTYGLLSEGILNKAAAYDGIRRDVTMFRTPNEAVEAAGNVLEKYGMNRHGLEKVLLPSGKVVEICVVPLADQVLKHQVLDKIQARSEGLKSVISRQPVRGRQQGGGLRNGEMEKDAFAAHGAAGVLEERMMKVSDEFAVAVCQKCGTILTTDITQENYRCDVCGDAKPGILRMPYPFKILLQFLNGMGINYRLNTRVINRRKNFELRVDRKLEEWREDQDRQGRRVGKKEVDEMRQYFRQETKKC